MHKQRCDSGGGRQQLTSKESPSYSGTRQSSGLCNDCRVVDCATCLRQRTSKHGQEDDWSDDGFEGEEVLDLDEVSELFIVEGSEVNPTLV